MQAFEQLASLAAAAFQVPSTDELLRWLRQLETSPPADLGPEWKLRAMQLGIWLQGPVTHLQLSSSPQQLSKVATGFAAAASKLLLHLAASKQYSNSSSSSAASSKSSSRDSIAPQILPLLLRALVIVLQEAQAGVAYAAYDASGELHSHQHPMCQWQWHAVPSPLLFFWSEVKVKRLYFLIACSACMQQGDVRKCTAWCTVVHSSL